MFGIKHPVGWDGKTFISCRDKHLHHIMTYTYLDYISVILHWNKTYDTMPRDEKYGFANRHYHLKLSLDEAIALRDALDDHITNLRKFPGEDS